MSDMNQNPNIISMSDNEAFNRTRTQHLREHTKDNFYAKNGNFRNDKPFDTLNINKKMPIIHTCSLGPSYSKKYRNGDLIDSFNSNVLKGLDIRFINNLSKKCKTNNIEFTILDDADPTMPWIKECRLLKSDGESIKDFVKLIDDFNTGKVIYVPNVCYKTYGINRSSCGFYLLDIFDNLIGKFVIAIENNVRSNRNLKYIDHLIF